jgi:glycosyltransferase involved in cell wall biosynthesis
MNFLISVIIPVYNRLEYLSAALKSALSQLDSGVQVLVVDDGSAVDVRGSLIGYGKRVELHRVRNGGPAAARNHGIRHAKGEYVLFLDDDDYLEAGALQSLLNAAREAGNAPWVVGKYHYVDRLGQPTGIKHKVSYGSGDVYSRMIHNNLVGAPCTVLVRKDVLEQAGGFDESRELQTCEDYDLWLKLAQAHPVVAIPTIVANYRVHGANATRDRAKALEVKLRTLQKHKRHAREEFAPEFARSIAMTHAQLGDVLYVSGRALEARPHWKLAASAGVLSRPSFGVRLAKSHLPGPLVTTLRSLAARVRGARDFVRSPQL